MVMILSEQDTLETKGSMEALKMALAHTEGKRHEGLTHHSERGGCAVNFHNTRQPYMSIGMITAEHTEERSKLWKSSRVEAIKIGCLIILKKCTFATVSRHLLPGHAIQSTLDSI